MISCQEVTEQVLMEMDQNKHRRVGQIVIKAVQELKQAAQVVEWVVVAVVVNVVEVKIAQFLKHRNQEMEANMKGGSKNQL
jgi:hypothetical protein